jgi:polyhydroxyalkanoate synthesis repressor PhaR
MADVLQIKKYPNRRYYDATRRCHVTLFEVHELILGGHDICVTDSKTGEDITNLVLFQILLEQDQPKLDLFPASILHLMIRTNRQVLRSTFDGVFGPFLRMFASSGRQFDSYFRQVMGGVIPTPFDWTQQMLSAMRSGTAPESAEHADGDIPPPVEQDQAKSRVSDGQNNTGELEELQDRLAELTREVQSFRTRKSNQQGDQ